MFGGGITYSEKIKIYITSESQFQKLGNKAELPKNGRDHIRARNLAGSGCLLRAGGHRNDGRISVVLTMVGRSELGGWLPSVVVERATYGAYRDILSDGVKALQNAGMDVRFEVHL